MHQADVAPPSVPQSRQATTLIRTIGRWSLTALVVNTIIGSGIFGLPSVVSGRLGRMAPIAYLIAGAGMAVIAGCLAKLPRNSTKPADLSLRQRNPRTFLGHSDSLDDLAIQNRGRLRHG